MAQRGQHWRALILLVSVVTVIGAFFVWQGVQSRSSSEGTMVSAELLSRTERAHSKIENADPPALDPVALSCGVVWAADSTLVSVNANGLDCEAATLVAQKYFGAPASRQTPSTAVGEFSCQLVNPVVAPDPAVCSSGGAEVRIGHLVVSQELPPA
jgi:hypothetical protein